ncbi:MAG: Hint domain-containing protein [Cyanobacteria bacterium P01_F01_bin.143]
MANPGDIAFIGYNADGNDDFAIVVVNDLDGSSTPIEINFTDNEWDGSNFNSGEGVLTWTISTNISAGTVVTFNSLTAGATASAGSVSVSGTMNLAAMDEVIYAFEGDISSPTAFLAAFANDDGQLNLSNTGLTLGTNAIEIDGDEDVATYTGTRADIPANLLTTINDSSNWTTQDGTGDQSNDGNAPDLPFDTTTFECFLTGTQILTEKGYKSVETLEIGDKVQTAEGMEIVKWIAHQTVTPREITNPLRGNPIQIKAGALGDNLPGRDLFVSPDHALFVDGLLINAGALVNDISIVQTKPTENFVYHHVELEKHAILIAEGVYAESYLPQKEDRQQYDNGAEYEELYPEGSNLMLWPMDYPRISSWNKVPRFVSKKLIRIASQLEGQEIKISA